MVVEETAQRYKAADEQKKFLAMLESLPQSTALALVEYKTLTEKNWLMKWASKEKEQAYVRAYSVPAGRQDGGLDPQVCR